MVAPEQRKLVLNPSVVEAAMYVHEENMLRGMDYYRAMELSLWAAIDEAKNSGLRRDLPYKESRALAFEVFREKGRVAGKTGRALKYPFDKIEVGAAISISDVDPANVRSCACQYARKHGMAFSVSKKSDREVVVARLS